MTTASVSPVIGQLRPFARESPRVLNAGGPHGDGPGLADRWGAPTAVRNTKKGDS